MLPELGVANAHVPKAVDGNVMVYSAQTAVVAPAASVVRLPTYVVVGYCEAASVVAPTPPPAAAFCATTGVVRRRRGARKVVMAWMCMVGDGRCALQLPEVVAAVVGNLTIYIARYSLVDCRSCGVSSYTSRTRS